MKRKSILTIVALALVLVVSIGALSACNPKKNGMFDKSQCGTYQNAHQTIVMKVTADGLTFTNGVGQVSEFKKVDDNLYTFKGDGDDYKLSYDAKNDCYYLALASEWDTNKVKLARPTDGTEGTYAGRVGEGESSINVEVVVDGYGKCTIKVGDDDKVEGTYTVADGVLTVSYKTVVDDETVDDSLSCTIALGWLDFQGTYKGQDVSGSIKNQADDLEAWAWSYYGTWQYSWIDNDEIAHDMTFIIWNDEDNGWQALYNGAPTTLYLDDANENIQIYSEDYAQTFTVTLHAGSPDYLTATSLNDPVAGEPAPTPIVMGDLGDNDVVTPWHFAYVSLPNPEGQVYYPGTYVNYKDNVYGGNALHTIVIHNDNTLDYDAHTGIAWTVETLTTEDELGLEVVTFTIDSTKYTLEFTDGNFTLHVGDEEGVYFQKTVIIDVPGGDDDGPLFNENLYETGTFEHESDVIIITTDGLKYHGTDATDVVRVNEDVENEINLHWTFKVGSDSYVMEQGEAGNIIVYTADAWTAHGEGTTYTLHTEDAGE